MKLLKKRTRVSIMSSHSENNSKLFNKKTRGEKKTSNNMVNCVGKSREEKGLRPPGYE